MLSKNNRKKENMIAKVKQNEQIKQIEQLVQNAALLERSMMGKRLGMQYGGERNLYDAFGYLENPVYNDYRGFFDRMGIATRIVEMFPDDTWGVPPVLVDGESRSDKEEDQTSFIKEWNELVMRLKVWQVLREADVLCGIGHWSTLFLGAPGEFTKQADNGGLAYIRAYDEPSSQPTQWVRDAGNPMFGMPETYNFVFSIPGEGSINPDSGASVHYTRVIHVSENRLGTRYTGRPRLQAAINTLFDLEKIVGGAAEAVWLTLFKGIAIMAREGINLPADGTPENKKLKEQLNLLANRIQKFIALENVELKDLGVDEIRIRETFDIEIDTLCATEKIPKRILLGSERGELASSMDLMQWDKTIATRRTFFAEPEILNPLVSWLISHKVISAPGSGKWKWEWKSIYEPSLLDKSTIAVNMSQAADNLSRGLGNTVVKENEIRAMVDLPELDQQELDEAELEKEAKAKEEAERQLAELEKKPINVTGELAPKEKISK